MNILVLNGSPRPTGSTKQMVEAFRQGAVSAGHQVTVVDVYDLLKSAEMLVIASPIYYHAFPGR